MADALAGVIRDVDAEVIAVSYNDESWVTIEQLEAMVAERGGTEAFRLPKEQLTDKWKIPDC